MHLAFRAGALALACTLVAACDQQTLANACALKDAAYADWQVYSAAVGSSAKTQASVQTAYEVATGVCAHPPADATAAAISVGNAAIQIAIAVKAAKAKHPEIAVPASLRRVITLAGAR